MLTRTGQMGADATLIAAATSAAGICQEAIEMTRRRGRVVVVGATPLQFERDPFYRKEIDFLISCSSGPGRYDPRYEEGGQDYPYAYVRWTENRNMQSDSRVDFGWGVATRQADFRGVPRSSRLTGRSPRCRWKVGNVRWRSCCVMK